MALSSSGNLNARESEIKTLIEQDNREEAGKMLFDLIVSCVGGGDIKNANRLRDWLYEVNPMALGDIIKANEIIEEAMSGSINEQFVQAWADLKQIINDEEFTTLYHAMEEHQVPRGKQIVKTGSKLDALFFVTKGNVDVRCRIGEKEEVVKILEPGTMIGENCFEPSIWTVSLVSATPVILSVLRQPQLFELFERFPGLDSRLSGYYAKFCNIKELLTENGYERRRYERLVADQKITFQTLSKDGLISERIFRGELDTISQGGLSFVLRIVKRENRRALFGRKLLITIDHEDRKLELKGSVVAVSVQDLQEHDYAVHVSFDKEVEREMIDPLSSHDEDEEQWNPDEMTEEQDLQAPEKEEKDD